MPNSNSIFISYRRCDSNDVTGRIYKCLANHFGPEAVFKDVDSIPLGVDFRTHLRQEVGRCQVMVAVIGRTWLSVSDAEGRRRLENPDDWVRAEIETALGRNIPVIPLLVQGASLPAANELPESLKDLAYRNAAQARPDLDFDQDMKRLIGRIEEIVVSKLSRFEKLELERLKSQLSDLEQDYRIVANDLQVELDPTTKNRLKKRLTQIGSEIKEVEQQIARLLQ